MGGEIVSDLPGAWYDGEPIGAAVFLGDDREIRAVARRQWFQPDQGTFQDRGRQPGKPWMLLIDPGVGTLRRAQVAGPSPGQVPQILWMIDQTRM
jgi:hypothetical protein